jgi:hypothetical protein
MDGWENRDSFESLAGVGFHGVAQARGRLGKLEDLVVFAGR